MSLSVKAKMTLDLEASWWKYAGAKEATVRELFDESATRYYQRVAVLLNEPAAEAYSPMVVRRLRRLRDARIQARSAR